MSEMVEKVARAMAEKSKARQPGMHTLNSLPMDGKEDFLEMARAAIEAMRTMPPGMLSYLQMNTEIGAYVCANWAGAYSCMEEYHSKMIDAALKD